MFFIKPGLSGFASFAVLHMDYGQFLTVFRVLNTDFTKNRLKPEKHLLCWDPLGIKGNKNTENSWKWCFLMIFRGSLSGHGTNPMCRTLKEPGELVTRVWGYGWWCAQWWCTWWGYPGNGVRGRCGTLWYPWYTSGSPITHCNHHCSHYSHHCSHFWPLLATFGPFLTHLPVLQHPCLYPDFSLIPGF